jgi:PAS domain S-box-containing protein
MGDAMRAHDWSASPLGLPAGWPIPLRTAVSIMLGSRLPIFIAWGPDRSFLCNDACAEIVGKGTLGRPLSEIWGGVWDEIGALFDRVLAGGAELSPDLPIEVEHEGVVHQKWFAFSASPLREDDGSVSGIFAKVHDMTDRHVVEKRLRESEERFRLIADSAPVPMWVTLLNRKRAFANRAYVEFLGVSYAEAVDFDWRTILHPDDHDRVVRESVAGEATLKPFALEGRYRRCDGEWRWLRSISQPRWGPEGEHAGFIGVAHDVTDAKRAEAALHEINETLERRVEERTADLRTALDRIRAEVGDRERVEEALRQAQKMEAVGRLTGGIAHDFNNLLTPIIGGLEIIARQVEDERLKRLAEAALESGRRGAKLTTQLLAFSRIQRIRIAPVAVNEVLDNLRQILKHTIGTEIAVRTDLAADAGHALCDENQLENAILNLAINARDAMPEGGTLSLTTDLVREEAGPELEAGEYVRISVADTGLGMPPDVAERATEPFFSTKPVGKGTGLGLAQVYGIARQSGGTLRIVSREGAGTTVTLLLPHVEPSEAEGDIHHAVSDAADRLTGVRAGRIMVIDDDPDVRGFLCELLEGLGHRVEAFDDPMAAIGAVDGRPPDFVLIDFAMPGMNGAQLAAALRARHPGLPVAFVTGYAESDQLEGALGGDVPVLRKPFGVDELAVLVAHALARGAADA